MVEHIGQGTFRRPRKEDRWASRELIILSSRELTDREAEKVKRAVSRALSTLGLKYCQIVGRRRRGALLSKREREIIALVRDGLLTKEIGESLGITEQSVKNLLRQCLYKLDARNRGHAAVQAIRRGEIELGKEW